MRKVHIVGLVLVAVCALSALFSASAFALTFAAAEWLVNAAPITAETSVNAEGELLFANVLSGITLLCSALLEGTIGAKGADLVNKVFSLTGIEVTERDETGAGGFVCSSSICSAAEIWPVNLPFKSELMLDNEDSPAKFYDLVILNENGVLPGYLILCTVLGIVGHELCQTVEGAFGVFGEVNNAAIDVETLGALSPLGTCGENALDAEISNNAENVALIATLTGTLSVSE